MRGHLSDLIWACCKSVNQLNNQSFFAVQLQVTRGWQAICDAPFQTAGARASYRRETLRRKPDSRCITSTRAPRPLPPPPRFARSTRFEVIQRGYTEPVVLPLTRCICKTEFLSKADAVSFPKAERNDQIKLGCFKSLLFFTPWIIKNQVSRKRKKKSAFRFGEVCVCVCC